MNKEVEEILNRSPSPVRWSVAILLFAFGAIAAHSAILALVTGILIGAYFGNYRGRAGVMDAWQRDLQIQHKKLREERLTPCTD